MRNFKCYFALLFCFAAAQAAAQSLADIAASTDLTLKGEAQIPLEQKPQAEAPQTTALSVTRLPDIKLNEDTITKSVLTYAAPQSELQQAAQNFANGQEAASLYASAAKDASLPTQTSAAAAGQAALLYLQQAKFKEALTYASIATDLDEQSPLYQLIKVWAYSVQGKAKEARKEYDKLLFLTADFEYLTSAKMAVAMAQYYAKDYQASVSNFENLYGTDPYLISHAAFMMGRMNFEKEYYDLAQTLFEQAIGHDQQNYGAHKSLAYTLLKLKQFVPAWQTFASIYMLDLSDKDLEKQANKTQKYLNGEPKNYLFYTRLKEIYTTTPSTTPSQQLRVALFSNIKGEPASIQQFSIVTSNGFKIKDESLGTVLSVPPYAARGILFNAEHSAAIIQSKGNNSEFATKRPFVIELDVPGSTALIQDAQTNNIFAANTGDKELKGNILVVPHKDGLTLINYTTLEDALPAMLLAASQGQKYPAALQALAVVIRTQIAQKINASKDKLFDISDNDRVLPYGGVNMQAQYTADAVKATQGEQLLNAQGAAQADFYPSCSTVSDDGVRNTANTFAFYNTPENLFKFMLSNPPADLLSAPQDPTLWSAVKWIYITPFDEVQARLQKYNIGKLNYVQPAQLTPQGRVLSMRFSGSKKTMELPFEEASFILSAGTLRSNFFFMIPFGKEGKIKEFMFLGTDSGLGRGLCIDGAIGMARKGMGKEEILNYYFPSSKIIK